MSGGRVVHSGWLKKSPPEKKLRLCAWRRRWFVLRSSHQHGDPGVLEYYKQDHSKKPLRIINLTLCEQVHSGVTFHKKGLPDGFVFDVKTKERTFYLVAGTKEDMNKWVQIICQVCGLQPQQENTDSLGSIFSATLEPRPTQVERNSSSQQRSTNPSCCSQPSLLACDPSVWKEPLPTWSTRAPGEHIHLHLHLHQEGAQSTRTTSFTEGSGSSFLMSSDLAVQKVSEGSRPGVGGACGEAPVLCIPEWDSPEFRDRRGSPPRLRVPWSRTRVSPTGPSTDSEDEDTFKTHSTALYQEFRDPPVDRVGLLSASLTDWHISKVPTLEKSPDSVAVATLGNKAIAAPPQSHKQSQTKSSHLGCPPHTPVVSDKQQSVSATSATVVRKKQKSVTFASDTVFIEKQSSLSFTGAIPKRRALPAVDRGHLQQAPLLESDKHFQGCTENAGSFSENKNAGAFFPQPSRAVVDPLDRASPKDDLVLRRSGPCTLLAKERAGGNSQHSHAPRSSGSPGHGPLSNPPTALPAHQDLARGSEVQPPLIDRSLKPGWKAKPAALDLCGSSVLVQSPSQPPRAISCTSQDLHPGDGEGMPVLSESLGAGTPTFSETSRPGPEKITVYVQYMDLDFQPSSWSPSYKPSRYFPASEEVDYVEVDREKTQALERTMQEWAAKRQYPTPTKGAKP